MYTPYMKYYRKGYFMDLIGINNKPFKIIMMYSIPSIIGMLLTSFITVIDGAFIGQNIGTKGLAAINLTLPVLYFILGITIMIGVGGSTIAIQKLGAHKKENANDTFLTTLSMTNFSIVLVCIFLKILLRPLIELINIEQETSIYLKEYLGTMLFFYPIMTINMVLGMFIRGEGKPQFFMTFSIIGNILNIILDYLFVYKFSMGMYGAALASGISVSVTLIIGLFYFIAEKSVFRFLKFKLNKKDVIDICLNGSSELIGQLSISITTALFNIVLLRIIGVDGVAAMTLISYIAFLQTMIILGIGQGIHPLLSYSFGAQAYGTVSIIRIAAQKICAVFGIITFLSGIIGSQAILGVFTDRETLISLAVKGLRLYSIAFIFNGFNIITSFYFTSLGMAKESAIISAMRGLILLSLNILVLPLIFGITGLWMAAPLAEIITLIVSIKLLKIYDNRYKVDTTAIPHNKETS